MNFELKVLEIPTECFILTGKIENIEIIENLKKFIKENINKDLSYMTHVKAGFTGFDGLINNNDFHKFLKLISRHIKFIYQKNFIISEAWGNVYKKSEEATPHSHAGITAFCGILYLTDNGPGTFFHDFNLTIKEEIGKFVLFHPKLLHSVDKIENDVERITVAFNMNECKDWANYDNSIHIKNDI
jgi:hypothetical protein